MADNAHGAEGGGLEFHPMDQFNVKALFGDNIGTVSYTHLTLPTTPYV